MTSNLTPSARGVLLVDFDATLFPWGPLDDDADPMPGAIEAMAELREAGYTLRIYSSRLSETWLRLSGENPVRQLTLMRERLRKHGIPHDGFAVDKEPAEHYIDDRAIEFSNNWPEITARLVGNGRRGVDG